MKNIQEIWKNHITKYLEIWGSLRYAPLTYKNFDFWNVQKFIKRALRSMNFCEVIRELLLVGLLLGQGTSFRSFSYARVISESFQKLSISLNNIWLAEFISNSIGKLKSFGNILCKDAVTTLPFPKFKKNIQIHREIPTKHREYWKSLQSFRRHQKLLRNDQDDFRKVRGTPYVLKD